MAHRGGGEMQVNYTLISITYIGFRCQMFTS